MKLGTVICAVTLALGCAFSRSVTTPVGAQGQQACLHGDNETSEQRVRRAQALTLARQINTNQYGVAMRKTKTFQAIADLELTAPAPAGFEVRLTTDGKAYAFSLRDRTDPCLFAYFSDQDGVIFQGRVIQ